MHREISDTLGILDPAVFKNYRPHAAAKIQFNTIHENIEALVNVLDMCIDVVVEDTPIPQAVVRMPVDKRLRNLDAYLVTQHNYGVSPKEAVLALQDRAKRLTDYLSDVEKREPAKYNHYCRKFTHVLTDMQVVTAALREVALNPNP